LQELNHVQINKSINVIHYRILYSIDAEQIINLESSRNKMSNARDHHEFCFKQAFS